MENNTSEDNHDKKQSLADNKQLNFTLGVLGFVLGIVGLYFTFIYNKKVELRYTIQSDIALTDTPLLSKIRVYYDSIEVKNVRALTISFWNSGNDYLPKEAISKDRPISIKSTKPVSILESRIIAITRKDLQFTTINYNDNITGTPSDTLLDTYDYIGVEIKGDEALEAGDGVTYLILYTGQTECTWNVSARIKGVKEGFVLKKQTNKYEPKVSLVAKNLSMSIALIGFVFVNFMIVKKYMKYPLQDDPYNIFVNMVRSVVLGSIMFIIYIWYKFFTEGILPDTLII